MSRIGNPMITASMPFSYKDRKKFLFPPNRTSEDDSGMAMTFEAVRGKSVESQSGNGVSAPAAEHDDHKLLDALRRSKLYCDYERTFTDATGLPLALRPVEFFGLPFHGKKNENPFCAFLAERKSCCAVCLQAQARLAESRGDTPHSVRCRYGLTETVVPVKLGERIIGFLCTGQVFTQREKIRSRKSRAAHSLPELAANSPQALRLWAQTPLIEPLKYKATVHLLTFFASQLSTLSNHLLLEQKSNEPAVVSRARRFIAANKRGRITLAAVAKASGASMFHFCTLFRASTGIKFTEYVARTRIEDARELLCNRQLRMCEVAYESGFQSVAAFHRAFQRILGQSPTAYRASLNRTRNRVAVTPRPGFKFSHNGR
jgi:AraC-like DNA-binding protein/ligand-binding sensor protein